ncbi:cytochrome C oxidase subunit IV family protein [Colwellia sp. E150_009]
MNKKNTLSWLWLLALTILSVYVGTIFESFNAQKSLFIGVVLFIVFLKGQQIIDVFMELKHAPKLWRRLLLGYVIVLPIIIGIIYLV